MLALKSSTKTMPTKNSFIPKVKVIKMLNCQIALHKLSGWFVEFNGARTGQRVPNTGFKRETTQLI